MGAGAAPIVFILSKGIDSVESVGMLLWNHYGIRKEPFPLADTLSGSIKKHANTR